MAQLMQAWRSVGATIDPAQAITQRVEDTMGLPVTQRLS